MSRYFNSFMDNSSEELEHSWGTSPKAKAREKEYNHWYYQKHKDELKTINKLRYEAINKHRQAEKNGKDAERYWSQANQIYVKYFEKNPETLTDSNFDSPYKSYKKYTNMYEDSEKKYMDLYSQADRLDGLARVKANTISRRIKNPKVRDLVEFYLDTTFAKAKKSASKAAKKVKKYATKAMSTAEKTAKKYATKAVSNAEKYATKTVKSAANKAKKYVVR